MLTNPNPPRSRRPARAVLFRSMAAALLVVTGGTLLRAGEEPTPAVPTATATPVPPAMAEESAETPAPTPADLVPAAPTATPRETAPAVEPMAPPPVAPDEKPAAAEPSPAPAATPTETPAPPAPPPPVVAATPAPATAPPAPEGQPLEARDLEAFLDGLIPPQLLAQDIAGLTVCVVKDGETLLTKGYGYADFKARKPVSGEETLFRPGSISKTFVAVAVMQLVEAGQLNLDRDVNDYLDFRLPARAFPQFLTLRQLLTHTAGFEESVDDLFITPEEKFMSLRDYVRLDTPRQLFPPGTVTAYSNYGVSLAGYVVEHVGGQPFADYVATRILGPLGMTRATFLQPPPEPLGGAVSLGYHKAGDKEPIPFERVPASPAGGLSATAADMGRFMRMLLNGGSLDGKQILSPESVKALFARQHEAHTALNAMGLVFYGGNEGDRVIIGHGGDTIAFHSDLFLLPASKTGVFLSINSQGAGRTREVVRRAFLDRYFPTAPAPAPASAAATDTVKADSRAAAGNYQTSRRVESGFLKVGNLMEQATVDAAADGSLTISSSKDLRGHPVRWEPVAGQPLVYRERGGPRLIAFQRDAKGGVNTLYPAWPGMEFQRVPWYEHQIFALPLVGAGVLVILATALLWPVAALVRRRYRRPAVTGWTAATFFVLTRLVCVIDAVAIAGWLTLLSVTGSNPALLNGHHLPWQLPALYILGRIGAAGGVVVLVGALVYLHPRLEVRRHVRWQQWLLVPACVVFALFTWHWHLLG